MEKRHTFAFQQSLHISSPDSKHARNSLAVDLSVFGVSCSDLKNGQPWYHFWESLDTTTFTAVIFLPTPGRKTSSWAESFPSSATLKWTSNGIKLILNEGFRRCLSFAEICCRDYIPYFCVNNVIYIYKIYTHIYIYIVYIYVYI